MDQKQSESLRSMMKTAFKSDGEEDKKQTFVLVSIFEVLMAIEANQTEMMERLDRMTNGGNALLTEAV